MNFFCPTCQESPISVESFGICDNQNGTKAYTNTGNKETWIAEVANHSKKTLTFTAIDKCVIKDNEEPERGRCDGMLTSAEHLYFIELKDQGKGWIADAIRQLESTIQFFIANHDVRGYRYKKAFACNKRHPHFQEISNEQNLHFYRTYGFRLDIHTLIKI